MTPAKTVPSWQGRRHLGRGPRHGLHPRAAGILATPDGRAPRLDTRHRAALVLDYLAAVAAVLGPDWLDRHDYCPAREAWWMTCDERGEDGCFRHMRGCVNLCCPANLVGYVGQLGLPVLFVRAPPRPQATCRIAVAGADPMTLAEVGTLWGMTRECVRQAEAAALEHARRAGRNLIASAGGGGG